MQHVHSILLAKKSRASPAQTALLFEPGDARRDELASLIPMQKRKVITSGWVVEDAYLLNFVNTFSVDLCPGCASGSPCPFGMSSLPGLERAGYRVDTAVVVATVAKAASQFVAKKDLAFASQMIGFGASLFRAFGASPDGLVDALRRQGKPVDQPRQKPRTVKPVMTPMMAADILGVDRYSDATTIQRAFGKKMLHAHPDRGGTADMVMRLKLARDTLVSAQA